jgi:hypothetical protein
MGVEKQGLYANIDPGDSIIGLRLMNHSQRFSDRSLARFKRHFRVLVLRISIQYSVQRTYHHKPT